MMAYSEGLPIRLFWWRVAYNLQHRLGLLRNQCRPIFGSTHQYRKVYGVNFTGIGNRFPNRHIGFAEWISSSKGGTSKHPIGLQSSNWRRIKNPDVISGVDVGDPAFGRQMAFRPAASTNHPHWPFGIGSWVNHIDAISC